MALRRVDIMKFKSDCMIIPGACQCKNSNANWFHVGGQFYIIPTDCGDHQTFEEVDEYKKDLAAFLEKWFSNVKIKEVL